MSNDEVKKCGNCEFLNQSYEKSIIEGQCIFKGLNQRRKVVKNINDTCRQHKFKGSLAKEVKTEYKKQYSKLIKEWKIAGLKKLWWSLDDKIGVVEFDSEEEKQLLRKMDEIEEEVKKLGGDVNK